MRKYLIAVGMCSLLISACTKDKEVNMQVDSQSVETSIVMETTSTEKEPANLETTSMEETAGGTKMDLSNVTINTQNSIRIAGSKTIYFDPISIQDSLMDADMIFITHEHSDHFEPNSMKKISNSNTKIVAPESMRSKILGAGLDEKNCVFLSPNETVQVEGLDVSAVWAYNVGKAFHEKSRNWLGYKVDMDGICYYVAGDTDVNDDVKKVKCDIAFLPIGGTYTMDWKEAAAFVTEYKPCRVVVPTHYGSIVGNITDGTSFKNEVEKNADGITVELFFE